MFKYEKVGQSLAPRLGSVGEGGEMEAGGRLTKRAA